MKMTSGRSYLFLKIRIISIMVCVVFLFALAGCIRLNSEEETSQESSSASTITTEEPTATVSDTSVSTSETESETSSETTVVPTTLNTANMYSSYTHMESFDPSTGLAEFDYFDILKGQDAIDWLVDHEGYSVADATTLVNDFADSEFVYKNINPQLRIADMSAVSITMMYEADGTQVLGADTVPLTYSEFVTLYNAFPDLVLDSFFYHVTVVGDVITEVDQVYWP